MVSATSTFTDQHRVWLIGGALAGHSLFAMASGIVSGHVILSPVLGIVVIGVTVLLLTRLDLHLRRAATMSYSAGGPEGVPR